jgi:hypothetical protein
VHGPWAFVLSLTRWEERRFGGGETELLAPSTLTHWQTHAAGAVVQRPQLTRLVPPRFNQLTVFDPRVPHGVREVRGTRDPRAARVVLHGWFVEPGAHARSSPLLCVRSACISLLPAALRARPASPPALQHAACMHACMHADMFVEGALDVEEVERPIMEALDCFRERADTLPAATGTLVLRLAVAASGRVHSLSFLTDTLMPRAPASAPLATPGADTSTDTSADVCTRDLFKQAAAQCFSFSVYPQKPGPSTITMPLLFD